MKILTAKSRIAVGLVCLLLSVLCTAMMIGLVPERRSAVLSGRAATCETIAMASSDYISRGELRRVEFLLKSLVERNDDILSAGVRRTSGELVAAFGEHSAWNTQDNERSTESQVQVPIRYGLEKWGSVELRFRPLRSSGLAGWLESPWLRLTAFVTVACYLLFVFYLRKMLAHLDPSKTVPRRVRSALDSLAEGLLVIDRNQRIVLANQSFAAWLGRDPEKLIGVHAAKLDWVKDQNGAPLDTYPWVEAIRLEAPQAGVMLGIQRPGEPTRVMIANASPVLGHDGKYRGVLVSFDDVTQLEETKKDLHFAMQAAEEANHAKSEFLARMSHEIRTPMNAILGYTDVLRRGFDESVENRQEYLDTIHSSGEHLLALINDILDLSKVESGQMELDLQRCSPHHLISQVATLLRSKAEEKGLELHVRFAGRLPETILADSVRLRQTIVNLAGNAIKFTEQGSVTLAARLVRTGPAGKGRANAAPAKAQLAIDVIDTGIGIPQAVQQRVFEPFAQADTSVTRRFGGTGLGLAISKQLAEAMGGGISITSEEGKGSTFTVTIDIGSLDGVKMVKGESALAAAKIPVAAGIKQVAQLPPARILVADDGEANRKLLQLVLGRAGANVVAVENGQLAVEAALEEPFDVILMDMQMPVMDGYTATTTLRQSGYESQILALTAHAMQGDEEKCRAAGCSGFLTKPIKIDILLETLSDLLAERYGRVPPRESQPEGRGQPESENQPASENRPAGPPRGPLNPATDGSTSGLVGAPAEDRAWTELTELTDLCRAASRPESPATGASSSAIPSSLPVDDPEFLEIVVEFVERLAEKLGAMRAASAEGDDAELARLAHWLKGSGGTAGFDVFSQPAEELEAAAKAGDRTRSTTLIEQLIQIAGRLELPGATPRTRLAEPAMETPAPLQQAAASSAESPLVSSLPMEDADFREIVEDFVQRLTEQLDAMTDALVAEDFAELARLAHWLKGSGGTAGFDAFTMPARALEQLASQQQRELAAIAVDELRQIAGRIADPTPV